MKTLSLLASVALASAIAILVPAKAYAGDLACPAVADLAISSLAAEAAQSLPAASELAEPAKLQAAVQLLREHGMSQDDTINYLIAVYCPTVSQETDLDHEEKLLKVRQFAASAARQVLAAGNVEAIVFDVALPRWVADGAKDRAANAGQSVEQWIASTVQAALK